MKSLCLRQSWVPYVLVLNVRVNLEIRRKLESSRQTSKNKQSSDSIRQAMHRPKHGTFTFFGDWLFQQGCPRWIVLGRGGTRGFVVGGYSTSTGRETGTWIGRCWGNVGVEVDSRLHSSEFCIHSALSNPIYNIVLLVLYNTEFLAKISH